jgi:polyhydroxybutyrate depolymerase
MRLWTSLLLCFAVAIPVAAIACNDDPAVEAGSSSGEPTDDDDDSGKSSSGKTSSGNPQPQEITTTTEEKMDFGGRERLYYLTKPKKLDASKKLPLVINFHGNPGTPQGEMGAMPFEKVTKEDAIIVYPRAAYEDGENAWSWDFSLPDDNADMPWIPELIDDIAKKVSIDKDRVLAFGYSGGAYFLSQYACRVKVGGFIKMVAFVSGGAPQAVDGEDENSCVQCPGGDVPIFIAHGENDTSDVAFIGGDTARQCFAKTNGCTDDDLTDITAPCKSYGGCNQPVTWCPVPNHGHEPWSDGMKQAWDLFKALP